jgi:hypothetical protein
VSAPTRFSQAIAEGAGISLVAVVEGPGDAEQVEAQGADAILVSPAERELVEAVRAVSSLPLLVEWAGDPPSTADGVDACVLAVDADREWLEHVHTQVRDTLEVAFWIANEDQLQLALERFDAEMFILAAPEARGDEALEQVLDLLPDVPAGKLAIAELETISRDDLLALERAGVDAVIVAPTSVASLADDPEPEV